jgi:hypothetical protein
MESMEKKGRGIKFKIILAVIGIVALLLLLSTQYPFPGFPKFDFSSFEGFFSSLSALISPTSGEYFTFKLSTDTEPLEGQRLKLQDSTLTTNGSVYILKIGDQVYQLPGTVEIDVDSFSGEISFASGFLKVSGDAKSIVLDRKLTLSPSKNTLRLQLEIVPFRYSIEPIKQDKLSLQGIYGSLQRTSEPITEVQLINASLDITGFVGRAELDKEFLITGSALKIESKKFKWSG